MPENLQYPGKNAFFSFNDCDPLIFWMLLQNCSSCASLSTLTGKISLHTLRYVTRSHIVTTKLNQRTYGLVNAHLISGLSINTKHAKPDQK